MVVCLSVLALLSRSLTHWAWTGCEVDNFGIIDPYAKGTWDGEDLGESEYREKTQRPRWDWHIKLDFVNSSEFAELVIDIWDKDKVGGEWQYHLRWLFIRVRIFQRLLGCGL